MLSLCLSSVRDTTRKLFLEPCFDWFHLMEASISGAVTYSIDGRCNLGFFASDTSDLTESETVPDPSHEQSADANDSNSKQAPFIFWKQIRPVCFSMIKGKRAPLAFRFVFFLLKTEAADQFQKPELAANADIDGYLLVLHYKNQKLTATTGTSFLRFSFDKESEQLWDRCINDWLRQASIETSTLL